jgi:ABC-type glycerol-3-phosphate transport system substrate-binding protein
LLYQKLNNKTIKKTKMKKVVFALVIAAGLTACGSGKSEEAVTDSTAVAVDSTVVTTDTTAAPVATDSVVAN